MNTRHHNEGTRKRCACPRRRWPKCEHPWWGSFSDRGAEIRFSIPKHLGLSLNYRMSKTEAMRHRNRIKHEYFNGDSSQIGSSNDQQLTFSDLADRYLEGHVRLPSRREGGRKLMQWQVAALRRIEIPGSGGVKMPFERKQLDQITKADVEAIRREWRDHSPRAKSGEVGCNRLLTRLRHMFSWSIAEGLSDRTPFKRHGVSVIKLNSAAETPRHRRLEPGEEERLLASSNLHLRALIIAALETGMRLGELLALQWKDIKGGVILRPPEKTKTNASRPIPMTRRLGAVLEMRRHDPTGELFGPEAYVFGNAVGEQARSIRTAWTNCRRRANVQGLHFHDLRREFASRLLESPGVALHDVAQWIGHANVLTATRYLATTGARQRETLKRFEQGRESQQTAIESGPTDFEAAPREQGALETS